MRTQIRTSVARCTVLEHDGVVAGYAVCSDDLIDLMMIDQAHHRRGLGAALLAHVERELFQRYPELRLESFEGNQQANTFYRKNGWRDVKTYVDRHAGCNKILFTKRQDSLAVPLATN